MMMAWCFLRYPLHAMYCGLGPHLNLCDFSGKIITMPMESWVNHSAQFNLLPSGVFLFYFSPFLASAIKYFHRNPILSLIRWMLEYFYLLVGYSCTEIVNCKRQRCLFICSILCFICCWIIKGLTGIIFRQEPCWFLTRVWLLAKIALV